MPGHDGCNMAPIVWVKKKKAFSHHDAPAQTAASGISLPLPLHCPSEPRRRAGLAREKARSPPPPPLKHATGANSAGRDESWNSGKLNLSPPSQNPFFFFSYWPIAKDYCSFLRRMGAARYTVTSAPIIPCKRVRLSLQRKLPTLVQIPQVTYMLPRPLCGLVINHQTGKWWALISPLET